MSNEAKINPIAALSDAAEIYACYFLEISNSFRGSGSRFQFSGKSAQAASIIFAFNGDGAAHLVKATAEARADAVLERFGGEAFSLVSVVGGKDGQPLIVVATTDDVGHRVEHPV